MGRRARSGEERRRPCRSAEAQPHSYCSAQQDGGSSRRWTGRLSPRMRSAATTPPRSSTLPLPQRSLILRHRQLPPQTSGKAELHLSVRAAVRRVGNLEETATLSCCRTGRPSSTEMLCASLAYMSVPHKRSRCHCVFNRGGTFTSDPFSLAARPQRHAKSLAEEWDWQYDRIHGVNIGGCAPLIPVAVASKADERLAQVAHARTVHHARAV